MSKNTLGLPANSVGALREYARVNAKRDATRGVNAAEEERRVPNSIMAFFELFNMIVHKN